MQFQRRIGLDVLLTIILLGLGWDIHGYEKPIRLTDPSSSYHLSTHPSGCIAWDRGRLLLLYWEGGGSTSPATPSRIWFRTWDDESKWSEQRRVDQSFTGDGRDIGGREPSLLIRGNGEVHIFWQDYRHCTGAGGWSDNVEIYTDRLSAQGDFLTTDTRLTYSNAPHTRDNGATPRATDLDNNRIAVVWTDRTWDKDLPKLALQISEPGGAWNPSANMDDYRLIVPAEIDDGCSYRFPDVAYDATSRTLKLVYQRTTPSSKWSYVATIGVEDLDWVHSKALVGGLFQEIYQPKMKRNPLTQDILIHSFGHSIPFGYSDSYGSLYIERIAPGALDPTLIDRKQNQIGSLSSSFDFAIDHAGQIYKANRTQVFLDIRTPASMLLINNERLFGIGATADPLAVTTDDQGAIHVVWEEKLTNGNYALYYTTNRSPRNSVRHWMQFEP